MSCVSVIGRLVKAAGLSADLGSAPLNSAFSSPLFLCSILTLICASLRVMVLEERAVVVSSQFFPQGTRSFRGEPDEPDRSLD